MPSSDEWIIGRTHELLDVTKGVVSSGAFQRHGEIVDTFETSIRFSAEIEAISTETLPKTEVESDCPICHGSPYNWFSECVLQDPFTEEDYDRALKKSHHRIECPKCESLGEVSCHSCNGNGRSKCSSCDGVGRREYDEECWMCDGSESPDTDCPECGGAGTILVEQQCGDCAGKGHVRCKTCYGNGIISCNRCQGEGILHKYDQTKYNTERSVSASGLPLFWESDPIDFVNKFNWKQEEFDILENGTRSVRLKTPSVNGVFISIRYGDDHHNALLATNTVVDTGIWDPETGYPKTSVRRKLGDLKSLFLR